MSQSSWIWTRTRRAICVLLALIGALVASACFAPPAALATGSGVIKGSLTVPSGVNPTDVEAFLLDPEGNEVGDGYATLGDTSTTGDYEFDNLASGQYEVLFRDPINTDNVASAYYASAVGGAPTLTTATPVVVTGATTTNPTVTSLVHGGVISGTINDANTGTENTGDTNIWACVATPSPDYWLGCSYDIHFSGGTYAIEGLPPGTYTVTYEVDSAAAPTYFDDLEVSGAGVSEDPLSASTFTVSDGQTQTVNFSVPEFGSIAGTVSDPGGAPSQGTEIRVYDSSGQGFLTALASVSGTYTIAGLLPGSYRLWFRSATDSPVAWQFYSGQPTLPLANAIAVGAGQAVTGINVTYAAQATISGTVTVAGTGATLAGVTVYALDSQGDIVAGATTAANGTYTIDNLPAGTFYLVFGAVAPNYMGADDTPEFNNGSLAANGEVYAPVYYGGTPTIVGATGVAVTSGQQLTGINAALGSFTTAAVIPPVPPVPPGFAPKVSGGSLTGIAKRKPALKLTLAAGVTGAPKLVSFALTLPAGFGFNKSKLAKDLALAGVAHGYTLKGRAVTLYLSKPEASVKLTIKAGGLTATKALGTKAKKRKIKSETLKLSATDVAGASKASSLTIKKPH